MLWLTFSVFAACFLGIVFLVVLGCTLLSKEEKEDNFIDDASKMRVFMKKYIQYEEDKRVGQHQAFVGRKNHKNFLLRLFYFGIYLIIPDSGDLIER